VSHVERSAHGRQRGPEAKAKHQGHALSPKEKDGEEGDDGDANERQRDSDHEIGTARLWSAGNAGEASKDKDEHQHALKEDSDDRCDARTKGK
jgi:hypothetical protein